MTPRTEILWRVKLIHFILLAVSIFIFGKTIHLFVFFDEEIIEKSTNNRTRVFVIEPIRGDICAFDGRVLATSVPYYEVAI
ncbi:MAG TPA: peptidoglycan glycosyltransferase, partial [Bacteroidales bacterium]|nr:peptidoglycan glycosyltransferase [Bacteroidales bacterium]